MGTSTIKKCFCVTKVIDEPQVSLCATAQVVNGLLQGQVCLFNCGDQAVCIQSLGLYTDVNCTIPKYLPWGTNQDRNIPAGTCKCFALQDFGFDPEIEGVNCVLGGCVELSNGLCI